MRSADTAQIDSSTEGAGPGEGGHDLEAIARLYGILGTAADLILRAEDRGQVFDAVCHVLTDPGDFHVVWIGMVQPDGTVMPVARSGAPSSMVTLKSGGGAMRARLANDAVECDRTVVVDDLAVAPGAGEWTEVRAHYGVRSGCAVPIRVDGTPVAVLCTYMTDADAYDTHRIQLVERLADGASYVLQALADRQAERDARIARAATEAELAARSRMHAELARIGQLAFTTTSLGGLFAEIADAARRVLDLDLVIMEELGPEGELQLLASSGAPHHWPSSRTLPPSDCFGTQLLTGDDALVIADLWGSEVAVRFARDGRVRAAAGVVIRRRERAHGSLIAASHTPRLFHAAEVDFLHSLAHVAGAAIDHSEARRRLQEQALHDPLTGLPNRTMLYERLEHAAASLRPGRHIGVLLIDLDDFKLVNDALGHDTGDQLLVAVAARIAETVREGDLVARLGGDEFAVLCHDLSGVEAATEVAQRVAEALREPFDVSPVQTYVTASIGITLHDGPTPSPRALLRDADVAMYVAKDEGRSRFQVYDDGMHRTSVQRLTLINDLRRALEQDQFELVWHPIVSLDGIEACGPDPACFEALLRWRHPERGLLGPDAFVAVAEEVGLIAPIGEWALRAACRQLARWRAEGGPGCPEMISVNLSAQQLVRPEIVDEVTAVVAAEGIEPQAIVLEITETAFMRDHDRAVSRLHELSAAGFVMSIDDFGTGYSSLAYLRDLPARGLKIDRSFVRRLRESRSDRAIVEAIVALAHAVDMVVVAEGVETTEQLELLRAMGCDRAQGFLWTRPLPAEEVVTWVARHRVENGLDAVTGRGVRGLAAVAVD